VVKYGLIADPGLLDLLETRGRDALSRELGLLGDLVTRCAAVKARWVSRDERDLSGERATLNFGHTVGHALESASGYRLLHGEAVALGMVAACRVSARLGVLADATLPRRLRALLEGLGLPSDLDAAAGKGGLRGQLGVDKKRAGGQIAFQCIERAGRVRPVSLPPDEIVAILLESAEP
jgi:3-dehydroquinate synthetase